MYKIVIAVTFMAAAAILMSSCSDWGLNNSPSPTSLSKASSLLLYQVSLRRDQLASPTPERLAQMQGEGMNLANLSIQKVFIYLHQQLTASQAGELRETGITVYTESWIPPVGNNPDGFYLADMPLDKLEALAGKAYVTRLDTAEKRLQFQSDKP